MNKSPILFALELLIEAELRDADTSYAAAAVRVSHALIVLFESSGKEIADFSEEYQEVIEHSYLVVYGQSRESIKPILSATNSALPLPDS